MNSVHLAEKLGYEFDHEYVAYEVCWATNQITKVGMRRNVMGELSKLPNIGKTVEAQLVKVGINSVDDLRKIGAREAWLKIQEIDDSACINRLMALEGAI